MTTSGLFPRDTFTGPDGTVFTVPDGWEADSASKCRSCYAPVLWCVHDRRGSRAPFDPDGTSHFATCVDAASWRRPRR